MQISTVSKKMGWLKEWDGDGCWKWRTALWGPVVILLCVTVIAVLLSSLNSRQLSVDTSEICRSVYCSLQHWTTVINTRCSIHFLSHIFQSCTFHYCINGATFCGFVRSILPPHIQSHNFVAHLMFPGSWDVCVADNDSDLVMTLTDEATSATEVDLNCRENVSLDSDSEHSDDETIENKVFPQQRFSPVTNCPMRPSAFRPRPIKVGMAAEVTVTPSVRLSDSGVPAFQPCGEVFKARSTQSHDSSSKPDTHHFTWTSLTPVVSGHFTSIILYLVWWTVENLLIPVFCWEELSISSHILTVMLALSRLVQQRTWLEDCRWIGHICLPEAECRAGLLFHHCDGHKIARQFAD